ncbi:MAG: hypothetical protein HY695_29785 [Deltaproteobacteria bacterium]|nr:hypothetical protein [Deltaproteobacteria bacterium]
MDGHEVLHKNEGILRGIIRSIDKNLDYTVVSTDDEEGARFSLKISMRGRAANVSLSLEDLRLAASDAVRKNSIRQKIKNTRDHMMDNRLPDVLGIKVERMLKAHRESQEAVQHTPFRRSPRR